MLLKNFCIRCNSQDSKTSQLLWMFHMHSRLPISKSLIKQRTYSTRKQTLNRRLEKYKTNPKVTALYAFRLRQPAELPTWLKLTHSSRSLCCQWPFYLFKELILEGAPSAMPSWSLIILNNLTAHGYVPTLVVSHCNTPFWKLWRFFLLLDSFMLEHSKSLHEFFVQVQFICGEKSGF